MAATLVAGAVNLAMMTAPKTAACAPAQAASPFEVLPRPVPARQSHWAAYGCALAGAGLVVGSFPLTDRADRHYAHYLRESDPSRIESRWNSSVMADRLASGSLLAGEALLASAVYLRFIRRPRESRVAIVLSPAQCALSLRF